MTTPTLRAECDVASTITPFVHGLGGPVDVVGYDGEGNRVGVIVNPITDDEVEVIDPTETALRLVATPAGVEGEDDVDAIAPEAAVGY